MLRVMTTKEVCGYSKKYVNCQLQPETMFSSADTPDALAANNLNITVFFYFLVFAGLSFFSVDIFARTILGFLNKHNIQWVTEKIAW